MREDDAQETQVLIVGGGPVGLSAAVELGQRGIPCLVVEPRTEISPIRPRAKTTSVRSMEHFRRWGLAERVREVAPLKVAWSQDIVFCTTLLGQEVTRFTDVLGLWTDQREVSPEAGQQIAQPLIEAVLREAVAELNSVELALGWSLHTVEQDDRGVRAVLINPAGEQRQVSAAYALGCDGARSAVRAATGIQYHGTSDARANLGFVFRAPGLAERHHLGPAVQYWILNPASPGLLGRMDLKDRWWAIVNGASADTDAHALINGLVGAEVDSEILGTDPWTARMLLADKYREGRLFLAGDAAHLNPPWGGHGFNTGIGDAVNIGWKLAAVLQGWGGEDLLDSYEAERRSVAERTIAEAARNMSVLAPELGNPQLTDAGEAGDEAREKAARTIQAAKDGEFHSLGLVLGYQYNSSPVIVGDGSPAVPEGQHYRESAGPGARLPHLWLADGASLYDHLGSGFTLLCLQDVVNITPFVEAASKLGVPLKVVEVYRENAEDRYGAPLVLVRPDQHVAWRGVAVDEAAAAAILDCVRGILPLNRTDAIPVTSTPIGTTTDRP